MKRFIATLTTAAVLSMPLAASALESMDNTQLKSATGQAGVSIAVDDIVIYQEALADVTYWDTDGLSSAAGTVGNVDKAGIKLSHSANLKKLTTIDAILDANTYGVAALKTIFNNTDDIGIVDDASAAMTAGTIDPSNGNMSGLTSGISPLTIDVGTCQALTAGFAYNYGGTAPADIAGVVIGLPTVEITTYSVNDITTISLTTDGSSAPAANANKAFIAVEKTGYSKMAILGGRLEIAPH